LFRFDDNSGEPWSFIAQPESNRANHSDMRIVITTLTSIFVFLAAAGIGATTAHGQGSFSWEPVANNDFTAFGGTAWGIRTINHDDTVIKSASPNGAGCDFPSKTASLFSFNTAGAAIQATPEPNTTALAALGALAVLFVRRRA